MVRKCKFMSQVDGVSKFWESYCIDRQDAIAQMREIYTTDAQINVVLFQYVPAYERSC